MSLFPYADLGISNYLHPVIPGYGEMCIKYILARSSLSPGGRLNIKDDVLPV